MSHHRQQLPGFGQGARARLRRYEDGAFHIFQGPGYVYPAYRWTLESRNEGPIRFTEYWKQDVRQGQHRDAEAAGIDDKLNWWMWTDATITPNPDGTVEDLNPVDVDWRNAGGFWRAKVRFDIEVDATDLPVKVHAVWCAAAIRPFCYGPIQLNGFIER